MLKCCSKLPMFGMSVAIVEHWQRALNWHANYTKLYIMEKNMAISDKVIDELLKDYSSPDDLIGEHRILKQLNKRLLERIM